MRTVPHTCWLALIRRRLHGETLTCGACTHLIPNGMSTPWCDRYQNEPRRRGTNCTHFRLVGPSPEQVDPPPIGGAD